MFLSSLQNTKRPRCMRGSRNRLPAGCGLSPHPLHAEPRMPVTTAKASRPLAPFFHSLPKLGRLSQTLPRQLRVFGSLVETFFHGLQKFGRASKRFFSRSGFTEVGSKGFSSTSAFSEIVSKRFPSHSRFTEVGSKRFGMASLLSDMLPKRFPGSGEKTAHPENESAAASSSPEGWSRQGRGGVQPRPASLGERRPGTTNAPELLP